MSGGGCRACQVACKDRNDLDIGLLFRYAKTYETGSFPKVGMYNYSGSCNHCENPVCVDACPSRALDFGEREELIAKYGPDLVKDLPILPDSKLTNPNTLIKAKPCALEENFRELPT